ncbi:MAG: biotin/lipoyl-binding protein [Tissierellia bacterium]|nr:biotin/lipoyl-binding protein [Tissierellia bacterium]
MKKFNVTVNGKTYAVEVEEVGAGQGGFTYVQQAAAQAPVQQAPAPQAVQAAQPAPQAPVEKPAPKVEATSGQGTLMSAPMPGTILDILVSEGQTVKKGEIVIILEAMKMENEIAAAADGVVSKIHTSKSANVNAGDPMLTIA